MVKEKLPRYLPSLGRLMHFADLAKVDLVNRMLAKYDLQLPQWIILSALWRKDGLLVTDIARYTEQKLSAVSRLVDRMGKKGLVERKLDAQDKRASRIFLTEKAREMNHLLEFYHTINDILLEGFTKKEALMLFDMLERVTENAKEASVDKYKI